MTFRPAPVPTLASAAALVVLVNLSAWQYRRHVATEDLRVVVHHNLDAAPADAASLARPAGELTWRRVSVTGTFDDDKAQLALGRFEGGKSGYEVLVPFHVEGGPVVLVNRGWIPGDGWDQALASVSTHGERVAVDGLALAIEGRPDQLPLPATDSLPERWPVELQQVGGCTVGREGTPIAAIAARYEPAPTLLVVVGPERRRGQPPDPAHLPIGGYVAEPKTIGHLSYAGQWAMIALTLVSLWTWAGFRRGRLLDAGMSTR